MLLRSEQQATIRRLLKRVCQSQLQLRQQGPATGFLIPGAPKGNGRVNFCLLAEENIDRPHRGLWAKKSTNKAMLMLLLVHIVVI